ncbi:uncharacterized protein FIBRA_05556 [Fibroporia radiculosa]|uniref:Cytochrome P450 n=1 Tax=Fibroporia radiculosa TaxID=599839 RepID=J4GR88_9APHY|nr:uncharacterized protein FIBRA_05556 [Fibroporia radiculosa]CCM03425.1 predicted protein [Fibroporia radiculosa]
MVDWTSNWAGIAVAGAVICAVSMGVKFVNGLQVSVVDNGIEEDSHVVNHWPGVRCAVAPTSRLGILNPLNSGLTWLWMKRSFDFYEQFGTDTISMVPFIAGKPQFYTANVDVARQVVGGGAQAAWIKPPSPLLDEWGTNLFTAERDVWLRHRKIIGPAFNNDMYSLVWEQTVGIYHDIVKHEGWLDRMIVQIPIVQNFTSKLAFLIIAVCGFGMKASWSDETNTHRGDMSISEALRIFTMPSVFRFFPAFASKWPIKALREISTARHLLDSYMRDQVDERRELVKTQITMNEESGRDIFSLLVRANELNARSAQDWKMMLTDNELISNVFLLLFAGHETTAHTLAATFALLAVHQDVQDDIHRQIIDVVGPDRDPTADEYHKLNKVLNAFYEAGRMFPASFLMVREAAEDTSLVIPNSPGGGETTIVVPQGTGMIIDTLGMENNPRYYPEPTKFMPSRWEGEDKADLVTGFSFGQRNCIGRRFSQTEAVAFLTMWLRDWKVEPLLNPGETINGWRARVLEAQFFFTLGVKDVPILLKRRVTGSSA